MARFSGKVGYAETVEEKIDGVGTGKWVETYQERQYYGDVIRNRRSKWESSGSLNDNITFSSDISIVADPFACNNFQHIRYVIWMNQKFKVSNIELQYPRLILSLGGVYNEQA